MIELGTPDRSVVTTCAYCGVGCSFKAELNGDALVRMVPDKDGKANRGHSCVKGRFAWGYANHRDRILNPMIRDSIDEPWREVSWDEAMGFAADRIQGPSRRAWPPLHRRHHLVALHQRGDLPRPEAGPRGAFATTTPTPARGSAIRPPATGWARPSAPPRARRISTPSSTPMWSSSSARTRPTGTRCSPRG